MIIKLEKIKELADAIHPNNIVEGFNIIGEINSIPTIGECFYVGGCFRTSYVKEIIDQNTFKTCNSIYIWHEIRN